MKPTFLKQARDFLFFALFASMLFAAPRAALADCTPGGINPPTLNAPSQAQIGTAFGVSWSEPGANASCTLTHKSAGTVTGWDNGNASGSGNANNVTISAD